MIIVHVVHRDKFTSGYINFMKKYMTEYEHYFIVLHGAQNFVDVNNIFFIQDYRKLSEMAKNVLNICNLIVFSGVFDSLDLLVKLPTNLLRKTYLHFWGAEIYTYSARKSIYHIRYHIQKFTRKYIYKRCAGFIFLIDGEQNEFKKIFRIKGPSFIAPMPEDNIYEVNDCIRRLRRTSHSNNFVNILIGNSASPSNQHMEALQWMERYLPYNIKIYIPLSYGSKVYRDKVIRLAKEKYGDTVVPVLNYMDKITYIEFLSQMDVAIVNTNRQQALGNINLLLALGKKLYIRDDTPMWKEYLRNGYNIFSTDTIKCLNFKDFLEFDDAKRKENEKIYDNLSNYDYAKRSWKFFFENCKMNV